MTGLRERIKLPRLDAESKADGPQPVVNEKGD